MKVKRTEAFMRISESEDEDFTIIYLRSGFPHAIIQLYEDPTGLLTCSYVADVEKVMLAIDDLIKEQVS